MASSIQKHSPSPGRILLPPGISTALSMVGDNALYTVLPTHTLEAGISMGSVGVILSINRIVRLVFNSIAGAGYDRSPRRRIFLFSIFIGALSTVLYAITTGFWSLLCGRILWGLAWSGIWVGGSTIVLDITNSENRGRWMGFLQIWFYLGGVLGAIISGVGTDWLGYSSMLWVAAALGGVGWVVSLLFLPETRLEEPVDKNIEDKSENSKQYLTNPIILIAAFLQGINRFANAGVLAATIALLVKDYIATAWMIIGVATLTGLLSGLRMILSMAASPLIGIISDRMGNRWKSIFVMLFFSGVSMFLIGKERSYFILIGIFLASIASGSLQTLTSAVVGDAVMPAQRGKAVSLLYTSGDLGSALGPVAAYAVLPWIGLSGVYMFCAVLFFACVPMTMLKDTLWKSLTY
jgi:MFS family permease